MQVSACLCELQEDYFVALSGAMDPSVDASEDPPVFDPYVDPYVEPSDSVAAVFDAVDADPYGFFESWEAHLFRHNKYILDLLFSFKGCGAVVYMLI